MSKTLNTIQELWSYCSYCHICKEYCRVVSVAIGPDSQFQIVYFEKDENILKTQCIYKKSFVVDYNINCLDSTFKIKSSNPDLVAAYCYFVVQGICRQCSSTYACGTDLELDFKNNYIYNIGIDRESTYLLSTKDMYHVTMLYKNSTMLVSKCFKDENGTIIDDHRFCTLPLVDLDFSDSHKIVHRIKTMLVFS